MASLVKEFLIRHIHPHKVPLAMRSDGRQDFSSGETRKAVWSVVDIVAGDAWSFGFGSICKRTWILERDIQEIDRLDDNT